MSTNELLANANGIEICYETHGDPSDEPLLLVMGLGSQLIHWPLELVDALVDRGFYVVRYDNRDTGRSTKFDHHGTGDFLATFAAAMQGDAVDVPYLLSDMARDAVGLLDALAIDAAHVVGVSMGGMIAQTLAIEHPERVRTLTSIMSTTGAPGVGQPTADAMAALMAPVPTTREEAIEAGVATRRVIGSPAHFDESLVREVAALAFDRCWNPAGTARHLLAIAASGSRESGLAALEMPVLVIHGDVDPLVTPTGGARTAEVTPGAELVMIEGMGHDLPRAFTGPIVEAITSLTSRATHV
ncbi:MAG: alpha/beta fold hydrolase [Microthrixaceae bacterium]